MIDYTPFWKTIKDKGVSTYTLINRYNISSSTLDRLRKRKPINTTTINDLCRILDCKVEDIIVYIPSDKDSQL
ncbi:MAG TPA: helix-turn-helix transcriptional regulator [Candidatus Dorea intestinavium]|nr:helix-turn-helix transcriptional regulator [Candidatus Dorea intestinavium]